MGFLFDRPKQPTLQSIQPGPRRVDPDIQRRAALLLKRRRAARGRGATTLTDQPLGQIGQVTPKELLGA